MSPLNRSLVAVLLVAGAGTAGFLASRALREPRTVPPPSQAQSPPEAAAFSTATPPSGGAASRQAGATPAPRAIPDRLPEFVLNDRDGVPRSLSHWRDQPLLVNFWATWCAPCRREIPLLRQIRTSRRSQHLEVVGIAVDFRDAVLAFARNMEMEYPLLIGEQEGLDAAAAFGIDTVFPFTIFADRQHRIVAVKIGELHADEAAFILDRVGDVDAGKLDLAGAKMQIADALRDLAVARAQHKTK